MKNLKNLNRVKILNKNEQKSINGGGGICASICANDIISCKWIYHYCQCDIPMNCY